MSRVVEDFIQSGINGIGIGYFENSNKVVQYAQSTSKCQRRKWRKKDIIPAAFLRYLEAIGAIPKRFVPEKERKIHWLADQLWEAPDRNRPTASEGEHLRVALLKELDLMPSGTCSAQHIYTKIDHYGSVPKPRKTRKPACRPRRKNPHGSSAPLNPGSKPEPNE